MVNAQDKLRGDVRLNQVFETAAQLQKQATERKVQVNKLSLLDPVSVSQKESHGLCLHMHEHRSRCTLERTRERHRHTDTQTRTLRRGKSDGRRRSRQRSVRGVLSRSGTRYGKVTPSLRCARITSASEGGHMESKMQGAVRRAATRSNPTLAPFSLTYGGRAIEVIAEW